MPYIPNLLANIDQRLDELAAEIAKLESARTALTPPNAIADTTAAAGNGAPRRMRRRSATTKTARGKTSTPAVTKPEKAERAAPSANEATSERVKPRRRVAAGRPARGRRSKTPLTADDLERLLSSAEAGLSASAIAEQANAGYDATLTLLRKLAASGQVRREGYRRSTVWRPMTDEKRIAERAAKLERRAASRS